MVVLVLQGVAVVEGVKLPEDLVVGHGHLRAGPLGLRGGDLVLERVQQEVHEVLVPGQVEVDLDIGEESVGVHGKLLPNHMYTKHRELRYSSLQEKRI